MDTQLADEIIDCLPTERTLFRYYKGHFANLILAIVSARYATVDELKRSPFERLTKRPEVKPVLAKQGNGEINQQAFQQAWQEPSHCFRLSIGRWHGSPGTRGQTSRRGVNLVLQLNFSNQHNRTYRHLYKPQRDNVFNYYAHPVANGANGRATEETLAWARIDLDASFSEALIEEIQSDWVRRAGWEMKYIERCEKRGTPARAYKSDADQFNRLKYLREVLLPYLAIWQEVMLAATIWFLRQEFGIRRVFIHTPEGGKAVKKIRGSAPPRSIYYSLPRKFCFETTAEAPGFIAQEKSYRKLAKNKSVMWQHLSL